MRASFAPHPHPESNFRCVPMADRRVSHAEQQDHQVPLGAPSKSEVIFLMAPIVLCLIGAVALVGSFF